MSTLKRVLQLLFQQDTSMPFSLDKLLNLFLRVQKLKGEGYMKVICLFIGKKMFSYTLVREDQIVTVPSNNNKNKLQLHSRWKCSYFVVPGRW